MTPTILNVLKVLLPAATAFALGVAGTPLLTHYLYKHRLWKKRAGKISPDGREAKIFNQLHETREVGTPRFGGVVIWGSVIFTVGLFSIIGSWWPETVFQKLNFLSRNQTWLPLFTLVTASLVGLVDDWFQVSERGRYISGGLRFSHRLIIVTAIGLIGAWWFYFKLEQSSVIIPFIGEWSVGWLIMPIFVITMLWLFGSGVIDGLDGLAGGLMAIIFAAYAAVAFFQHQIDLAALAAVIAGATLAFLWFNIPPARFYMSETGILGLTTTLTVFAFLTDSILILPLIALPLFVTALSVVIQLSSKKFRHGKKVFLVAPLHHHFEARGWPPAKVVMRYWVIGIICALLGLIILLIGT